MKYSDLKNKLIESDDIISKSFNYKSRNVEAIKGHIKRLESENKGLKAKHETYGESAHKITWSGPKYLVSRAHNIMSQFNTPYKSKYDWMVKRGLQESLVERSGSKMK